ncbi:MAG TPA: hypothetical protein PLP17_02930, partial [Oligoflexia bacterium]|nr:hypothetical protein [Oligoflexia bacterium]
TTRRATAKGGKGLCRVKKVTPSAPGGIALDLAALCVLLKVSVKYVKSRSNAALSGVFVPFQTGKCSAVVRF